MVRHRRDTHISQVSSSHKTPLSQIHASVRQKRKYNKQKKREVTWTKAPKFAGQATFNLNKNMISVPSSKAVDRGVEYQATTRSPVLAAPDSPHNCSNNDLYFDSIRVHLMSEFAEYSKYYPIHRRIFEITRSWRDDELFPFDVDDLATVEGTLASLLETLKSHEAELMHYAPRLDMIYSRLWRTLYKICDYLEHWCMHIILDHGDPRAWRIASLRLGLYASVQRVLTLLSFLFPRDYGKLFERFNMPVSMWKECVYQFMEVLKYRKTNQIHLDSVEQYLLDAKDVVRSLQRDAPHLHRYWNSYLAGLDHYIDCLDQIREGRTDWSHPDVYDGDPEQQPPEPLDLSLFDNIVETSCTRGQIGHIDDNNHQYQRTYLGSFFMALSDRPAVADIALRGWAVFGQAIADTFDQYYQMYKILSFTSLPQLYRGFTDVLKSFLSSG